MKPIQDVARLNEAIAKTMEAFGCDAVIIMPVWFDDCNPENVQIPILKGKIDAESVDSILWNAGNDAKKNMIRRLRKHKAKAKNIWIPPILTKNRTDSIN